MRHCVNLTAISAGFIFDSRYYRIKKGIVEHLFPSFKAITIRKDIKLYESRSSQNAAILVGVLRCILREAPGSIYERR
jgi:hypothetical protein